MLGLAPRPAPSKCLCVGEWLNEGVDGSMDGPSAVGGRCASHAVVLGLWEGIGELLPSSDCSCP